MAKYKYYNGSNWVELLQSSNVLTSVTYSQLATLINNSQLVPGLYYRIIDFVTTTSQPRTQSAGHAFDLIVQAISSNELSEDANACLHVGDTYFAGSDLKAWVLKYSFANDTNKYAWANTTNGKGVIYYMKDEFGNECGYDFKNIQFARYKVTACTNAPSLVNNYCGMIANTRPEGYTDCLLSMSVDLNDYKYFYTFDCYQNDYSLNQINKVITRPNGSTFTITQLQCVKCKIPAEEQDDTKFFLNNACILIETSRDCSFNFKDCFNNSTLLGGGASTISRVFGAIIGGPEQDSYSEAFSLLSSTVLSVQNSIVCCARNGYAISDSNVGTITGSYLVGKAYTISTSVVNVINNCVMSTEGRVISQSTINYMSNCNIKCTTGNIFHRSNIGVVLSCNGEGASSYCTRCTGSQLYGITMYDTTINQTFLFNVTFDYFSSNTLTRAVDCNIVHLSYSNLRVLQGCSFMNSDYITCAQDLVGCNFGNDVHYLTLSSTNTAQAITNTNIHDIKGTSTATKNYVIPEDYSTTHTVDIYSKQYHIHEID